MVFCGARVEREGSCRATTHNNGRMSNGVRDELRMEGVSKTRSPNVEGGGVSEVGMARVRRGGCSRMTAASAETASRSAARRSSRVREVRRYSRTCRWMARALACKPCSVELLV